MNCIIVDDDQMSCKILEGYVAKSSALNLIGTFSDSVEARNIITKRRDIDLVILDIHMPELDGFDFINSLDNPPNIIIVTGTEEYALKAFDFSVVDYLLKPFSYGEFLKAVQKAEKLINLERKELPSLEVSKEFLFIKSDYKIRRIDFSEIHYIEGLKDYVKIFLRGEKKPVLSLSTMKALEARLPEERFMRVHRSYIVNLETVKVIERGRIVYGEVRIPVTDQYRERFQEFLDRNFI